MEETTVKAFISSNEIDGIKPSDHYNENTSNIDPYTKGEETVGTVRILGGRATRIKIYHKEDKHRLEQETPPRHGYLGHFTATIKNKYRHSDRITLTDISVTKIEPGVEV